MAFFSRIFGAGAKYDDAKLVTQATKALAADPMITDPSTIVVTSQKGVITLTGPVQRIQERDRIEGVVRSALTAVGLKHERLINELKMTDKVS
jgi:osmotically-inducible protein OsmY